MTPDEAELGIRYLNQAWPYTPMDEMQKRQYLRLFANLKTDVVREAIDVMVARGETNRPGPASLSGLLNKIKRDHEQDEARLNPATEPLVGTPAPKDVMVQAYRDLAAVGGKGAKENLDRLLAKEGADV